MKHCTIAELNRRITINFELRNAAHAKMIGPDMQPLISPLSPEWAAAAAEYDALAAESQALYGELEHHVQDRPCRTCGFTHPEVDCPRRPANA